MKHNSHVKNAPERFNRRPGRSRDRRHRMATDEVQLACNREQPPSLLYITIIPKKTVKTLSQNPLTFREIKYKI